MCDAETGSFHGNHYILLSLVWNCELWRHCCTKMASWDGAKLHSVLLMTGSVKWYCCMEKNCPASQIFYISPPNHHFVFTIISAVQWTKLHLSSTIIGKIGLTAHVIYFSPSWRINNRPSKPTLVIMILGRWNLSCLNDGGCDGQINGVTVIIFRWINAPARIIVPWLLICLAILQTLLNQF